MLVDRTKVRLTHGAEHRALDAAERRHEGLAPAAGLGRAWTPLPAAYFAADQLAHLGADRRRVGDLAVRPGAARSSGRRRSRTSSPVATWRSSTRSSCGSSSSPRSLIANVRAGALFVATLVRPIELGAEIGALAGEPAGRLPPSDRGRRRAAVVAVARGRRRAGPVAAAQAELGPPDRAARRDRRGGGTAARAGRIEPPPVHAPTAAPAQVGATIGILERILIVVFVLASAEAAIGFVVAAKTLARFRLLDDRDFAEYYLLGTLASVAVAIAHAGSSRGPR